MAAVVDAIADYVEAEESRVKKAGKALSKVRARLNELKVWKYLGTGGALAAGSSPEEADAIGQATEIAGAIGPDPDAPNAAASGARSAQASRGLRRDGERDPVAAYRIVLAEKARTPVSVACELLGVSTSRFYAWASRAPSDRAPCPTRG
jgi:hypothetical protein